MTEAQEVAVDVVVVGLGAGGERVAHRLASAGLEVAAVERDLVGGECPFWGCTPSKLLIRSAELVAETRRAARLAGPADVRPDWGRPAARIREATHDWSDGQHAGPLEEVGARIVRGHGRLSGPGRVVVDGTTYVARRGVVLDTGTAPAVPDVPGIAGTPFWTNRDLVRITEPPRSVVVLGGGPIGCELATVLTRFGAQVTLLEVGDRLLAPEEPEAGAVVAQALRDEGVDVRTSAEVERVDHDASGFAVTVGGERVRAERLLVAAGRRPHLDDVGLETVGLDPGAETLETDERMRAGERLWAVGDITGRGSFTHVAHYQAEVCAADLLADAPEADRPTADYRAVCRVTFTDPEVGAVGRTEQQARDDGLRIAVGTADVGESSRGWIHGASGVVKVVADADRGVLVGATVAAPYGGEVVGLLSTAVHAEVPVEVLRGMHFAFPTFQLAVAESLRDLEGRLRT